MKYEKFCFLTPPTTRVQDDIFFPMGPLVLATLLQRAGIVAQLIDFDLLAREQSELLSDIDFFRSELLVRVRESQADAVGISSICSNFPNALLMAKWIREEFPEKRIILGGPQPSAVPKQSLEKFPFIDAIVIGEGEKSLLELLAVPWELDALQGVPGIAFRYFDQVYQNGPRSLLEDLDELPIPDFSLLQLKKYLVCTPHIAVIEAGRGCPFRCNFCSTAEFWSRKYRAKSPQRILREMEMLHQEYGMDYFCLTHDNFTTSPKYIAGFCNYFKEHNRKFTWSSSARTDTLKLRDIEKLYRAGCRVLFYGVDSGSQIIQKNIEKYLNLDGFKKILKKSVQEGIQATASFVIGFPEETESDLNKTISLGLWAKWEGANEVQFHRLSPLGTTKVYSENKDSLYLNPIATDISFQLQADPQIFQWIKSSSELFSSYYSVPTPHIKDIELFDFSQFYNAIINKYGSTIAWVFKKPGMTPTKLYRDWRKFTQEEYSDVTYLTAARDANFFETSFAEFL